MKLVEALWNWLKRGIFGLWPGAVEALWNWFEKCIKLIFLHCIVVGDFNANGIDKFTEVLSTRGFKGVGHQTRGEKRLDEIFYSRELELVCSKARKVVEFDHSLLNACFKFRIIPGCKKYTVRQRVGWGAIRSGLQNKLNMLALEQYDLASGKPFSDFAHIGESYEYVLRKFPNRVPANYMNDYSQIPPDIRYVVDQMLTLEDKLSLLTEQGNFKALFKLVRPLIGKTDQSCPVDGIILEDGRHLFEEADKNHAIAEHIRKIVAVGVKVSITLTNHGFRDQFSEQDVLEAWEETN